MISPGETQLEVLIGSMEPVLRDPVYVFVTVASNFDTSGLSPVMQFQEAEGLSLILEQNAAASAGLNGEFPCRMITLNIHSSLDAVGFLARITTGLAKLGVGVNPVSGFYHDHLFVPADKVDEVMGALQQLSADAKTR